MQSQRVAREGRCRKKGSFTVQRAVTTIEPLPGAGVVPLWPTQRLVEKRPEADAGLGEALGDRRKMPRDIDLIHGDDLFVLVRVVGLVIFLVQAARHGLDTVCDVFRGRNRKGLVRPVCSARAGPLRTLVCGHRLSQGRGNASDICPERALDDASIPHRMQVFCAGAFLVNIVAAFIIFK
jgi:hypothetical protein